MANTDNNDQIWAKKFNTTYDTTIKNYNTNIKKSKMIQTYGNIYYALELEEYC